MKPSKLLITSLLLTAGCSRDYTPPSDSAAEQMFASACAGCHQAAQNNSLFSLTAAESDLTYVRAKIRQGSWLMPGFPKLSNSDLDKLSHYVLENSDLSQ